MEITWHGLACFRMTERGTLSVVADPYDAQSGEELPKLKADVITVSTDHPSHNNISAISGAQRGDVKTVRGPGEYEMGGVFIVGAPLRNEKVKDSPKLTAYSFDFDGLRVVHMGALNFVPSQSQIDELETVHVLLLPVGGGDCLTATQAAELVSLIEPSVVIPMYFQAEGTGKKLEPVGRFLKEMGLSEATAQDSYKITKSGLPDETQIILLSPRK